MLVRILSLTLFSINLPSYVYTHSSHLHKLKTPKSWKTRGASISLSNPISHVSKLLVWLWECLGLFFLYPISLSLLPPPEVCSSIQLQLPSVLGRTPEAQPGCSPFVLPKTLELVLLMVSVPLFISLGWSPWRYWLHLHLQFPAQGSINTFKLMNIRNPWAVNR